MKDHEVLRSDKVLFSRRESAEVLGIGLTTLWQLLRSGAIRCVRVGRSVKVRRSELDRFLAENEGHWLDGRRG